MIGCTFIEIKTGINNPNQLFNRNNTQRIPFAGRLGFKLSCAWKAYRVYAAPLSGEFAARAYWNGSKACIHDLKATAGWQKGQLLKKKSRNRIVLAGDIGGTHTRLGIFSAGTRRPEPDEIKVYSSRQATCLEDILERFLKTINVSLSGACFSIAGPVAKGRSQTTNLPWEVSESQIKKRFNWPRWTLLPF